MPDPKCLVDIVAEIESYAAEIGLEPVLAFDSSSLLIEERVRGFCAENACGQYGRNHMCPPRIGTLDETRKRLRAFGHGLLLRQVTEVDVEKDGDGVDRTKRSFHESILDVEERMRDSGVSDAFGLIGGNCILCEPCTAVEDEPCAFPDRARPSLESMGVDVIDLLERLGLDAAFRPDRIVWTGAILFNRS